MDKIVIPGTTWARSKLWESQFAYDEEPSAFAAIATAAFPARR